MRSETSASRPPSRSAAHSPAVRRSCQTIARWIGRPVDRSHTIAVSRWFAIPMAATAPAPQPAFPSTVRTVATVVVQRSSASCSTSPGRGKCWAKGSWATAATRADSSKSRARVDVVPWSMASTYPVTSEPLLPRRRRSWYSAAHEDASIPRMDLGPFTPRSRLARGRPLRSNRSGARRGRPGTARPGNARVPPANGMASPPRIDAGETRAFPGRAAGIDVWPRAGQRETALADGRPSIDSRGGVGRVPRPGPGRRPPVEAGNASRNMTARGKPWTPGRR